MTFRYAFVEFSSPDEVQAALDEHQNAELDGRRMFLDKMGGGKGGGRGGRQSFGGRGGGDRRQSGGGKSSGGKYQQNQKKNHRLPI